jgi:hypothetical protein
VLIKLSGQNALLTNGWRMKDTLLWSRETDRRILAAIGYVWSVAFAGFIGWLLPVPIASEGVALVDGLIAAMLLVLIWGVFHLVQPCRPSRRWLVADLIAIPAIWILLIAVLALWFNRLHMKWEREMETMFLYEKVL